MTSDHGLTGLSPLLVLIMATATGLAVASNYFPQPLLPTMARDLGLSTTKAGVIVTTAQLGYAAGLLFLVPLGDLIERRGLIVVMALLSAAGLLTTALGKVVGTIMSGLLLGILLARTVAGALTSLGGWRTVYFTGAGAMVVATLVLRRALPRYHQPVDLSYFRLLLSIFALFRDEPVLRLRALIGAATFGTFSVFWTSMAFQLAGPPHRMSPSTIGLFGLVGVAGALAASSAGRLADRGKGGWATGGGLLVLLGSWAPLALVRYSMAAFLVGVLLLDLAVQGVHISNQAAIYRIRPEARNRLTAAYMTSYFLGGAAGSLGSAAAFGRFGWMGVVVLGATLSAFGGIVWTVVQLRVRGGHPR